MQFIRTTIKEDTVLEFSPVEALSIYAESCEIKVSDISYNDPFPNSINIIFDYQEEYWWYVIYKEPNSDELGFLNPITGEKLNYNRVIALLVEKDNDFDDKDVW